MIKRTFRCVSVRASNLGGLSCSADEPRTYTNISTIAVALARDGSTHTNAIAHRVRSDTRPQRLLENKNIPSPRDATSVAIKMGERPALNSLKTQSRSRLRILQLEGIYRPLMRYALLLISVDGQCWPSILTEVLGDVIGDTLRAYENENLCVLLADLLEVLDELCPLLEVTHDLNDLLDVVIRSEFHRADVDLDEVFQEVL